VQKYDITGKYYSIKNPVKKWNFATKVLPEINPSKHWLQIYERIQHLSLKYVYYFIGDVKSSFEAFI
jgi:hypothetical protein